MNSHSLSTTVKDDDYRDDEGSPRRKGMTGKKRKRQAAEQHLSSSASMSPGSNCQSRIQSRHWVYSCDSSLGGWKRHLHLMSWPYHWDPSNILMNSHTTSYITILFTLIRQLSKLMCTIRTSLVQCSSLLRLSQVRRQLQTLASFTIPPNWHLIFFALQLLISRRNWIGNYFPPSYLFPPPSPLHRVISVPWWQWLLPRTIQLLTFKKRIKS